MAQRGIRVLLGGGLMLIAGCAEPPSPPAAATLAEAPPAIFGSYVLDPAQSEEYDLTDPCGAPTSGTLVLEGGTWRRESHWAPGCIEGHDPAEPVAFRSSGPLGVRGDTLTLEPTDPDAEFGAEDGSFDAETVTVYGHCGGADVYVRVPADVANPDSRAS